MTDVKDDMTVTPKISIPREIHQKLENISRFLSLKKDQLIFFAFQELFNFIHEDPGIFLEEIGFLANLREELR